MSRPASAETAPYYFRYIDLVPDGDVVEILAKQLTETNSFLARISEEESLYRYAPDKWTIRQVLNHLNDTERVFLNRALWFARGFAEPLPSFDQDIGVAGADANRVIWTNLVEEFRHVRLDTLSFFRNLAPVAWSRTGVASGNPFTVRALAYIIVGHTKHHEAVIRERYLSDA
ncbi:MAG TPA: DinB family protein [Pyrinomonadaceae bacterium]|jgi:hypothetical protein